MNFLNNNICKAIIDTETKAPMRRCLQQSQLPNGLKTACEVLPVNICFED